MDMIRHQDICVHAAAVACGRVPKEFEVHVAIAVGEEAQCAVIAALNDVQRNAREF